MDVTLDAPADLGVDAGSDVPTDGVVRCMQNSECPTGQTCSARVCVPGGFGFPVEYGDAGAANRDAVAVADGARAEWPVLNGSERRDRRAETPGTLTTPVATWRFDTGQSLTASRIAVVDVDGDGTSEIVTAEGGGLRARRQDGREIWRTSFLGPSATISSAADLDGDGHPEFTLAVSPSRIAVVHAIDGRVAGDPVDFPSGYVQALVIPDMSGDGHPDVATFSKNLDRPQSFVVRVYSLAAAGLQQLWQWEEPNGYYGGPVVVAGDVDHDGTIDLTIHEYLNGWFRSFDRAGHVVLDGAGPRSGNAMYLRDVDGDPATLELLNAQDRNGVQTDGHELAVYSASGAAWTNVWRAYNVDAPPSQPILAGPWADAATDFDGTGPVEFLAGVYDHDASRGSAHWSMVMLRASDGMRLGSMPDVQPLAVVRTAPTAPPAILAMATPSAVAPPLGTTSFTRWNGTAFQTVWTRMDAAPAPIATRLDVIGSTGVTGAYASHGGVADIDGDGVAEVLLFARGSVTEFGDRPGELLAVSSVDGHNVAVYSLAPEDVVEVVAVEGSGDTLRVWLSSRQLGILALDRHFAVARRLSGSGYEPTSLVLATSSGPRIFVTDSSDVTHVLHADPRSADLVETARLNHRVMLLGTYRGSGGGVGIFVQDRNNNANVFAALNEQSDGTLSAAWTLALADAEQVQAVSRGRFGPSSVAGVLLQIRNTLDLPSSRYIALGEADGATLWSRVAPAPRPYIRSSLVQSAVVACGGDRVVTCTAGCRCSVVSGVDGASTPVTGIAGCDALNVSAGRADPAGDTAIIVGGGAYQTDLLVVHADCSVTYVAGFPSALQSTTALVNANGDARLDGAYWSDTACMHVRDGITGAVLWSRQYIGGAGVPCAMGAAALRAQTTPAAAGDVDGDGLEELVFGTVDGDLMTVSGANGDVRTQVHTRRLLREAQLADVDGDGRPEILAGADDGYLYVFAQPRP